MKRIWIVACALVVTLGSLTLAMLLGSASFDFRRYTVHQRRMAKVLREAPSAERLTKGLADEGTPLLAVLTKADVEREASARGGNKAPEIREKGARHAETRVYQAGDMLYFVYFDADGLMRDFTCVSR